MEKVAASFVWDGPERDILSLFVEPTPTLWKADPDEDLQIWLLRGLDDNEQETGAIAGLEIHDFLGFDRWEDLPKLPLLWQIQGWKPMLLEELLRKKQELLKAETIGQKREQAGAR